MFQLRIIIVLGLTCLLDIAIADGEYSYASLAEQLDDLSITHDIDIQGLELTESFPARPVRGKIARQIKRLLVDFNYVTIQEPGAGIEQIIILERKQLGPNKTVLHTKRQGKNHVIQAAVTGVNGNRLEIAMLVDTGADFVVLPKSMMEELGLRVEEAEDVSMQTANGIIAGKAGILPVLEIGNETIQDIEVAFIEDKQLNGTKLLGMNVLKHYRFTLDDQQQTITLIKTE